MTDEQIIEWARKADPRAFDNKTFPACIVGRDAIRAFARLVRNAALEDAAVEVERMDSFESNCCSDAILSMKDES